MLSKEVGNVINKYRNYFIEEIYVVILFFIRPLYQAALEFTAASLERFLTMLEDVGQVCRGLRMPRYHRLREEISMPKT